MFRVPNYCEGVFFDHDGNGYISWGKTITKFTLDGKHAVWAETGAPNGHKILADGTHLVCDASQHAVLHLSADGKLLEPASKECDGKPLRGPNDLTLDTPNGGFYFSDPGGSSIDKPIGTVHYVDKRGQDAPARRRPGVSQRHRAHARRQEAATWPRARRTACCVYDVTAPGKVGEPKVFAELPDEGRRHGADRQPARRHVPRRGRQSVRRPLRHEAGAGARSRRAS